MILLLILITTDYKSAIFLLKLILIDYKLTIKVTANCKFIIEVTVNYKSMCIIIVYKLSVINLNKKLFALLRRIISIRLNLYISDKWVISSDSAENDRDYYRCI